MFRTCTCTVREGRANRDCPIPRGRPGDGAAKEGSNPLRRPSSPSCHCSAAELLNC
jgi:hypothetical protein